MAMKNIMSLHGRGFLTDQQILVAGRFNANPNAFSLPPTLFRLLHDLIVSDVPLEKMEKARGWSARSAKVVLSQVLYALQELGGLAPVPVDSEEVRFLTGEDDPVIGEAMAKYRLTHGEAKVFAVMYHAKGRVVSKETFARRCYFDRSEDEVPDGKVLDVHICKARKKLIGRWEITTHFGHGYSMAACGGESLAV